MFKLQYSYIFSIFILMKIGNIVSSSKLDIPEEFNVVKSINDIIIGLPTLIIGWNYVDKNYPNYDITNIMISENLYWTFKKTEKRDKFEEDLRFFIKKAYNNLILGMSYVFIDPIQYNSSKLIKIIKKIKNSNNISYCHNNMIYIYTDNIIFGVDLNLMEYIGFNVNKLKNKLMKNSTIFLDKNDIFSEYEKYVLELNNEIKYIPYLYKLNNENRQ